MYVQGRDYNCVGSSCYGIGGIPAQVFSRLQEVTNAALKYFRIPIAPLAVDGKIGPGTLAAIVEIAKRSPGKALAIVKSQPTVAVVGQYASELVTEIQAIPSLATGTPVPTPTIPVPIPTPPVVTPQAPIPAPKPVPMPTTTGPVVPQLPPVPTTSMQPTAPANDYGRYWLVGGIVAVVGLVVAISVYTRNRLHERGASP